MRVDNLQIENIRGFEDSGTINFSHGINVIVGPNNAGKSTLLRCLYRLQNYSALTVADVRKGQDIGTIRLRLGDRYSGNVYPVIPTPHGLPGVQTAEVLINLPIQGQGNTLRIAVGNNSTNIQHFVAEEPNNLIFPFLAKRKVAEYAQTINLGSARSIQDNLSNLTAKIDLLKDSEHPNNAEFVAACDDILGFRVSTFPAPNGKQAGIIVDANAFIPLEMMGEGIGHLLGLMVSLCISSHKVFLIEELENDIHPKALKALLRMVAEKARTNQFILTTHSNIVAKFLGGEPDSKLFAVSMTVVDRLPTSRIREVPNTPEERREVLEELGYELEDYDLWKGYLFLEESSAETIIQQILIPKFAPRLAGKLRTIAAGGIDKIEPRFEDFDRLFLFTHLEPAYRDRAWVMVDGDQRGRNVIDQLKARYVPGGWSDDRFQVLSSENFESYYPARFEDDTLEALAIPDKQAKRHAKNALLHKVLNWAREPDADVGGEFETSAGEVITLLQQIETVIAS